MANKRKRQDNPTNPTNEPGMDNDEAAEEAQQDREEEQQPQEAILSDGTVVKLPQKRYYRQRAHANPLADHELEYPSRPAEKDWSTHYPAFVPPPSSSSSEPSSSTPTVVSYPSPTPKAEFADIGCGFGGLLMELSPMFPNTLMLGMEIRVQVTQYVHDKIAAQRLIHPGKFGNVSVIRANAMKFLTNFFEKGQLTKIFFLFPDPHFKARKHKQRIVSTTLLAEYAYVLRPGGIMYCVTDVHDLHLWTNHHLQALPELFEPIDPESDEFKSDLCVQAVMQSTEEGKKVARNQGDKYIGLWRRRENPTS